MTTHYDLIIALARTDSPVAPIKWLQQAGHKKRGPKKNYTTTVNPTMRRFLRDYELVDTEVRQSEVICKYRKIERTFNFVPGDGGLSDQDLDNIVVDKNRWPYPANVRKQKETVDFTAHHQWQLNQLRRLDPAAAIMADKCLEAGMTPLVIRTITSALKRLLLPPRRPRPATPPPHFPYTRGVDLRPSPRKASSGAIGQEIKQLLAQEPGEEAEETSRQPEQDEIERGYEFALRSQQRGFDTPFTGASRMNRTHWY